MVIALTDAYEYRYIYLFRVAEQQSLLLSGVAVIFWILVHAPVDRKWTDGSQATRELPTTNGRWALCRWKLS